MIYLYYKSEWTTADRVRVDKYIKELEDLGAWYKVWEDKGGFRTVGVSPFDVFTKKTVYDRLARNTGRTKLYRKGRTGITLVGSTGDWGSQTMKFRIRGGLVVVSENSGITSDHRDMSVPKEVFDENVRVCLREIGFGD